MHRLGNYGIRLLFPMFMNLPFRPRDLFWIPGSDRGRTRRTDKLERILEYGLWRMVNRSPSLCKRVRMDGICSTVKMRRSVVETSPMKSISTKVQACRMVCFTWKHLGWQIRYLEEITRRGINFILFITWSESFYCSLSPRTERFSSKYPTFLNP
jgi:hypothetical protein